MPKSPVGLRPSVTRDICASGSAYGFLVRIFSDGVFINSNFTKVASGELGAEYETFRELHFFSESDEALLYKKHCFLCGALSWT